MVVAVVLRAWGLGRTNLWFDEVNSWEVVRLSWPAMLANLRLSPVGPLYFVLLKPWQLVFGDSERALRSLSLVAGVLVVPVTYAIGVRTLSRRAAAWGAVLVALSPLHLYLSQEARMYMLLTLVAGLTVLAYAHWRDAIAAPSVGGRGAGGALVAYALAAAALLLTNVVAGPLLLALNLDAAIALARRPAPGARRAAMAWLAANAAAGAVFLLWASSVGLGVAAATQGWRPPLGVLGAVRALIQYPLTAVHGTYFYVHDFARIAREVVATRHLAILVHEWRYTVADPLALLAVVATLRNVPRRLWTGRARPLALALIVPLGIATIVSVSRQVDLGRYIGFASPFLFLLMGAGLARMRRGPRLLSLAVLLVAMVLGIQRYAGVTTRDSDYRPVARQLARAAQDGATTVLLEPDVPAGMLAYYLRHTPGVTMRRVTGGDGVARWLAASHGAPAWLVFDYRSHLFGASPRALEETLGARVLRDRYEGGVRLVLVSARPSNSAIADSKST